MNAEKKRLVVLVVASALFAIGLGVLIYYQQESIERKRGEIAGLKTTISQHRELIKKTPEQVKKVIVQRETDEVIKEILSDEKDINNLVRTLYSFAEDSDVTITSLKERRAPAAVQRGRKPDFEKVGYTIDFEGNAFHLLGFLNKVETHKRFMSVTAFKLSAAQRSDYEKGDGPRHKINMDLETYVYTPTASAKQVKIDHYERKRDLLVSEITKRASELRVTPYEYRGQRGRRDPWIDPRVDVTDGPQPMPIDEQLRIVAELVERVKKVVLLDEQARNAENIIEEMKVRAQLEEELAVLTDEILKLQDSQVLTYVLAEKRFENDVVAVVKEIVERGPEGGDDNQPSITLLRQTRETMEGHIANHEYELAINVFEAVEMRLESAKDEDRVAMVQELRDLHAVCETVIEFEGIELEITGVAVHQGLRPVSLINGRPAVEGDLIGNEVIIRKITPEQIEFAFRGLVLARTVN